MKRQKNLLPKSTSEINKIRTTSSVSTNTLLPEAPEGGKTNQK